MCLDGELTSSPGPLGTMRTATDTLKGAPTTKTPGSGVRRTFRLNVVVQTPWQGEEGSPQGNGGKTSEPVLEQEA